MGSSRQVKTWVQRPERNVNRVEGSVYCVTVLFFGGGDGRTQRRRELRTNQFLNFLTVKLSNIGFYIWIILILKNYF